MLQINVTVSASLISCRVNDRDFRGEKRVTSYIENTLFTFPGSLKRRESSTEGELEYKSVSCAHGGLHFQSSPMREVQ